MVANDAPNQVGSGFSLSRFEVALREPADTEEATSSS